MAWNGSSPAGDLNAASVPKRKLGLSPLLMRSLFVVGTIVAIGVIALYFVVEKTDLPGSEHSKPSSIADVNPDLSGEAEGATVGTELSDIQPRHKVLAPQKIGETRDGKILLPSGRLHVVKGVVTNDTSSAAKGDYEIFDNYCENEIACLLTLEPGEGLVGTPMYNGYFKKNFLESLRQPIIVSEEDTEEVKLLKRNVIQAKIEMKAALDRGEDIEQIMLDTRQEYQKLAFYKMDLKHQIDEARELNKDITAEDLEDLVGAANKMLEERGIAPLKYGPLIKQKVLMMREEALGAVELGGN